MILNKYKVLFSFLFFSGGFFACNLMNCSAGHYPSEKNLPLKYPKPSFKTDTTYFARYRNRGVQVKIILPEKEKELDQFMRIMNGEVPVD
jgi:hypothetical protein